MSKSCVYVCDSVWGGGASMCACVWMDRDGWVARFMGG